MRILAIETSAKSVSVALSDNYDVILELDSTSTPLTTGSSPNRLIAGANDSLPEGYVRKRLKGSSKTSRIFPPGASVLLAPMIQSVIQKSGQSIQQIDLIAVTTGPGSFTGLRVGVVTAKTLAYSIDAEIIGVNTLEVVSAQTAERLEVSEPAARKRICPIVNAQRQQVFAGYYSVSENPLNKFFKIEESSPNEILDRQTWLNQIQANDVLTGPGLVGLIDELDPQKSDFSVAPREAWACTASTVAKLACSQYEAGKRESWWELEPLYFRPSSAEEVRNAKRNRGV